VHVEDREVERIACAIQRKASAGESVSRELIPHLPVCSARMRRLVALSSTTSTRLPASSGCVPTKSRGASVDRRARRHDRERERRAFAGTVARAHMRPPMSSARRLLIARPSPVPPYLRVVDESACENDWNRRLMPSW
jgi:hypothetical protein